MILFNLDKKSTREERQVRSFLLDCKVKPTLSVRKELMSLTAGGPCSLTFLLFQHVHFWWGLTRPWGKQWHRKDVWKLSLLVFPESCWLHPLPSGFSLSLLPLINRARCLSQGLIVIICLHKPNLQAQQELKALFSPHISCLPFSPVMITLHICIALSKRLPHTSPHWILPANLWGLRIR